MCNDRNVINFEHWAHFLWYGLPGIGAFIIAHRDHKVELGEQVWKSVSQFGSLLLSGLIMLQSNRNRATIDWSLRALNSLIVIPNQQALWAAATWAADSLERHRAKDSCYQFHLTSGSNFRKPLSGVRSSSPWRSAVAESIYPRRNVIHPSF